MSWDVIFFYLIAAASLVTALGVVAARNPVHSGIFLILCFVNIAGIFVMLGAEFLAVIQIIVYTGAILVLVLFVIMLVDPGRPAQASIPARTAAALPELPAWRGVAARSGRGDRDPHRDCRALATRRRRTSQPSAATCRRLAGLSTRDTCSPSK